MKRILTIFLLMLALFSLSSCLVDEKETVKVIAPSGTPTLGIADALNNSESNVDYSVVSGSDALIGAFTNHNYDIIVAPVNLGSKFYNTLNNFEYVFYQTIVGGCFYLVTSEDISSFEEINGKEITVFGKNSTPDVIVRSLITHYNLDVKINYVNDVSESNAMLVSGKSKIIVSAEPSVQQILSKKPGTHVLDLQAEYKKVTNNADLPQAGIFVSNDYIAKVKDYNKYIDLLRNSVKSVNTNPLAAAENAMKLTDNFEKLGAEKLAAAVPGCNFAIKSKEENKKAINAFLNASNEILGSTYQLPNETFYL